MTGMAQIPLMELSSTVLPFDFNSTNYINETTLYNAEVLYSTTLMQQNDSFTTEFFNSTQNSTSRNRPVSSIARVYPIIAVEMALSVIGLIITIIVYSVLPEFRNVHGKNLISLSSCLLTTFIFLTLDLLLRKYISQAVCFTFGMITHISFLATFFWTHVMTYDIWKTMSELKPRKEQCSKSSNKYIKYSIYAWTATILTAMPALLFDQTDWISTEYRPKLGLKRCWLSGKQAFLIYFNAPVGVILFCNLVMFLLTTRNLILIKKMTKNLNMKQHQQRFHLYLKLFLVMGIIWTTEFLPLVTGIHELYALAGILTALHGVLLFIIFVCKRRILKQIRQNFKFLCCFTDSVTNESKKSLSTSQPVMMSSSSFSSSQSVIPSSPSFYNSKV